MKTVLKAAKGKFGKFNRSVQIKNISGLEAQCLPALCFPACPSFCSDVKIFHGRAEPHHFHISVHQQVRVNKAFNNEYSQRITLKHVGRHQPHGRQKHSRVGLESSLQCKLKIDDVF